MATPDYKAEKKDLDAKRGRNAQKWPEFEKEIAKGRDAAAAFADKLDTDLVMVKGFHEHADDLYAKWQPMADEIIKLQADLKKAKGKADKEAELAQKIDALHGKAKGLRQQITKNVDKANIHLKKVAAKVEKLHALR